MFFWVSFRVSLLVRTLAGGRIGVVEILGGSIGVIAGGLVGTVVVVVVVVVIGMDVEGGGAGLELAEGDAVGRSGSTVVS